MCGIDSKILKKTSGESVFRTFQIFRSAAEVSVILCRRMLLFFVLLLLDDFVCLCSDHMNELIIMVNVIYIKEGFY